MHILLIEDDREAAGFIAKGLSETGHRVDLVEDGYQGLAVARSDTFHAMIVDRMLPGLDGLSLIAALRAEDNRTPVLVLSALADVDNRVQGLQSGCDDYLGKPFTFSELLARLEALTRRSSAATTLRVADLEMDLVARTVTRAGQPVDLLPREFQLLEYLMRHAGDVVTRTMLLESVWNYHFDPQTNVLDVHVSRLRHKVDKNFEPALLHTVRGIGYRLG
jgi:two-component system, OmpR family, response regulator